MDRYDIVIAICVIVVFLAVLMSVHNISSAVGEKLLSDCAEHCAGRDMVVASHTIYGCECREGE